MRSEIKVLILLIAGMSLILGVMVGLLLLLSIKGRTARTMEGPQIRRILNKSPVKRPVEYIPYQGKG